MRGIFCIDPGESTGVAWGIVNERAEYAWLAVKERLHSDSTTVRGPEHEQIRALYYLWTSFKRDCVRAHCMEPEWIDLVIEDFVLFPGEKPGRATTTPERIAWGFEGYRMAMYDRYRPHATPPLRHISPVYWQKSGAAKRFSTKDMLAKADAWVRGREHERSAFAHMLLHTNILMDHQLPTPAA